MEWLDKALAFIEGNMAIGGTALGILWILISKFVSTEKAGAVVKKIQAALDLVALFVEKVGRLAYLLSQLIANVIKSDGLAGKK